MTPATPPGPEAPSVSARKLEMAHVLFMDVVAYSMLPMDEQQEILAELQEAVRDIAHIGCGHPQEDLICLPTGDGMALVFFGCPESPVKCALELARVLRERPQIKLRMGIHTGPVYRVADINQARNVAGGGINMAQRVMDCGDAGHILVSKAVADTLTQLSAWKTFVLKDLGEAEVKHGVHVHIFNLYGEDVGNSSLPKKLRVAQARTRRRTVAFAMATILIIALAAGGYFFRARRAHALTEKDAVVLADFANHTGDPIFDDTLYTALSVSLGQSPFLNILPERRVADVLKLMMKPAETKLTSDVAREVCLRAGGKAYIAGSIASLGNQYVITLDAVHCRDGDHIAQEMARADRKEKVLDALGDAGTRLRERLGESLPTVQKFDVPLAQATTSSLEALQAYTLGRKAYGEKGIGAGLPYFEHAVELDPNFAMGYRSIGNEYASLAGLTRASEYYTKAFKLRDHASEREKLLITADYYTNVTGEQDKAAQNFRQIIGTYPRDEAAYGNLGIAYASEGDYQAAVEATRQDLRLTPDAVEPYTNLANFLLAAQRPEDARNTIQEGRVRNLDGLALHIVLYALAFLDRDWNAIAEQQQWFAANPSMESYGVSLASDTEAYAGRLDRARQLTKRSADSAIRADSKEIGATLWENAALREAVFGNFNEARQAADAGLKLYPDSQGVQVEATLTYVMIGNVQRAQVMADELNRRYPLDRQVQSLWLPAINAQLALGRKDTKEAIDKLQRVQPPIEYGQIGFLIQMSCLYPTYIKGQVYLAAGQGKEAAAEFQKILAHSGLVWNCWTGALARLGVARANALQAKSSSGAETEAARTRALAAYKDFLILWKDADPDIPIYKEAKAEYAKLQ